MEIVKKHMITIFCVLAIILLALPLAQIEVAMEMFGMSSESTTTVTGFSALKSSIFAYILIIGPVLLIAMNYIKQLEPHKGILAIAVPVVCIVALIIVVVQAKSFSSSASSEYVSADIKLNVGIGAVLVGLSHIATIIAGAVTYHNFTLDKAGLEKIKTSAGGIITNAQEKASTAIQDVSHSLSSMQVNSSNTETTTNTTSKPLRKSDNLQRVDEVLALIEKLSKMKDAGILTENEFSDKKKQLLEELQ